MSIELSTPISEVGGVGEAYQKKLLRLGIKTIKDLVYYFPRRYEDYSRIVPIAKLTPDEKVSVQGIIGSAKTRRAWGRSRFITEALIEDDTGAIEVIWYNQPYLTQTLKKGLRVGLAGKPALDKKGKLVFTSPEFELLNREPLHTSRLVPVYAETWGVSSKWLRWKIHTVLPLVKDLLEEYLPENLLEHHGFLSLREAIFAIHFPTTMEEAKKSYFRFAFCDLLLLRLSMLLERSKRKEVRALPIPFAREFVRGLVKTLGVSLTQDQRQAAWDAFKDMAKPYPMQRLLQGDVGTGKTFVALLLSALVAKYKKQTVLMAPTEILAYQHFVTFTRFLGRFGISVGLVTRSKVQFYDPLVDHIRDVSPAIMKIKIGQGEVSIIIGTHRVIASRSQGAFRFNQLALVIIDEQHRFGVEQRAILLKNHELGIRNDELTIKGDSKFMIPHFLTMSATPIPRSLALTIYGNLDMSVLKIFPQGRRKVLTKIVDPRKRPMAYEFIRKKLLQGGQAYFIYPIIEESEKLDTKAALEEYQKLKTSIFPEFGVGLLHGRMKAGAKEEVMAKFLDGSLKVLVATSVVEVGIDVPLASIMVIEGAERFGLAQIHQLRGRIGRRGQVGFCFLFPHRLSHATKARLNALRESNDGFYLAQRDLEIRGPGELLGTRQAGIPDIAMDSLYNTSFVELVCKEADALFEQSRHLKDYPLFKKEVTHYGSIHLE